MADNMSHDKNKISSDDLAQASTLVADSDSHPLEEEKTLFADAGNPVPPAINSQDHDDDPLGLGLIAMTHQEHYDNNGDLSNIDLNDESVNEDDVDDKEKEGEEGKEEEEVAPLNGDDCNLSEMDESLASWDSADAREAAIRDGFIAFLISYVQGQFFQKFMGWANMVWAWFLKKIGRGKEEDDGVDAEDVVQEAVEAVDPGAMNIAGGGFGGPAPTPPGGVPMGPPPGVAEMAAAASQSAASAGAAGASAGAGAAAGSAAAGMAAAVASAGIAGQVGAAVGVAAVAAAAISSGLNVPANVTSPSERVPFIDNFVPPICSADSLLKEGYVELHIGGLPPSVLPDQKQALELLFR
jgi:hypothetical protein